MKHERALKLFINDRFHKLAKSKKNKVGSMTNHKSIPPKHKTKHNIMT